MNTNFTKLVRELAKGGHDVEAISGAENKAIEAYAGLPVGERV